LPDSLPRGFVTTQQAVARIFEARHADLISSEPEREAEQHRLQVLKDMSMFPPPVTPTGRRRKERDPPKFTPAHARRLKRLNAIAQDADSLWKAAAIDIRTALAEGDLSAVLQLDNGDQKPIKQSRWRAADGLSVVWRARDRMAQPIHPSFAVGIVLIKEDDFAAWSIGAPKTVPPAAADAKAPPIASAVLTTWYCARRDQWPTGSKPPSQDEDLTDARQHFPANRVTREAIRKVRSQHAPPLWTGQGLWKRARK
jgi:hypothetical protein